MNRKYEIDLNQVPENGLNLELHAEDISEISSFSELSLPHPDNKVSVQVRPIDGTHYEMHAQVHLKRSMSCSRCAEDYEELFTSDFTDYLSLDHGEEGEDQGFVVLKSPKWFWPDFLRELVELETPYQTYKYGENCLTSCKHYDNAIQKGWISEPKAKESAFKALESLKNKLN